MKYEIHMKQKSTYRRCILHRATRIHEMHVNYTAMKHFFLPFQPIPRVLSFGATLHMGARGRRARTLASSLLTSSTTHGCPKVTVISSWLMSKTMVLTLSCQNEDGQHRSGPQNIRQISAITICKCIN